MTILSMTVETVPISTVSPYPGNARRADMTALRDSLTTNGQYRPLVVQRSTGHVLAGNNTLAAARELGWTEIAIQYVDADDALARRILLADNRTNDGASYDDAALAKLLQGVDELVGTGFTDEEFDDLMASLEEVSEETFFTEPPPPPPPAPDAPRAGAAPTADGKISQSIGSNTSSYRALNDLHTVYEGTDRRSIQLVYRGADYIWAVEQLDALAPRYGTDNNADTVAALIAEASGTPRPGPTKEDE